MNHETEILDLIFESEGKAAPFITEKLSVVGNGKMAEGLKNLTDYAVQCGIAFGDKRSLKKGLALGGLGVSILFLVGMCGYDAYKNKCKRKDLLQKAVQNLDEGVKELQVEQIADNIVEEVASSAKIDPVEKGTEEE